MFPAERQRKWMQALDSVGGHAPKEKLT